MRYLILIYENEATADAGEAELQRWLEISDEMAKAGVMRGGEALQPVATATTVRVEDGRVVTTDGPFAETREQLGGFYLLECRDLEEAIRWASRMPNAHRGSIEVRPVMEFDQG